MRAFICRHGKRQKSRSGFIVCDASWELKEPQLRQFQRRVPVRREKRLLYVLFNQSALLKSHNAQRLMDCGAIKTVIG